MLGSLDPTVLQLPVQREYNRCAVSIVDDRRLRWRGVGRLADGPGRASLARFCRDASLGSISLTACAGNFCDLLVGWRGSAVSGVGLCARHSLDVAWCRRGQAAVPRVETARCAV